jgi:hypothetical protein
MKTRSVLLGAILVLATAVAGQTATGIRLVGVRFKGNKRLETVDLRKCAADLKSRTYEGPGWLAYITERVRLQCFKDKGYFKAVLEPSTKQLPDKQGTHEFVVTFNIDAGSQYRIGQISFFKMSSYSGYKVALPPFAAAGGMPAALRRSSAHRGHRGLATLCDLFI